MFIFLRLLLAHMIGDFPLQFDRIYKLKEKGIPGIIPHILIVTGCMALLSWPYLDQPVLWYFLGFLAATHLVQDRLKIMFSSTVKQQFFPYLIDQAFHAGFIALVLLTPLRDLSPTDNNSLTAMLYNNDLLCLLLIILIAASFNGHFMIIMFKKDFLKRNSNYKSFEKCYGMIERACIVCAMTAGGMLALAAVPLAVAARIVTVQTGKKYLTVSRDFADATEIFLTCLVGVSFGILFNLLAA